MKESTPVIKHIKLSSNNEIIPAQPQGSIIYFALLVLFCHSQKSDTKFHIKDNLFDKFFPRKYLFFRTDEMFVFFIEILYFSIKNKNWDEGREIITVQDYLSFFIYIMQTSEDIYAIFSFIQQYLFTLEFRSFSFYQICPTLFYKTIKKRRSLKRSEFKKIKIAAKQWIIENSVEINKIPKWNAN